MTIITVRIRKHERGLRFRHGDFRALIGPGTYRLWSRLWSLKRNTIEVVSTLRSRLEHPLLDVLVADPKVREALVVIDLTQTQRALVWLDGRLEAVLGPGRAAYWKSPRRVDVEVFDVGGGEPRLAHPHLESIVAQPDAGAWIESIEVSQDHDVLLFRSGSLVGKIPPGKHAFWKGTGRLLVKAIDKREKTADVTGQEIMTSDKVTLRVNLVVTYQVIDALKAVTVVSDHDQSLYREAQLALRAAVGTRTLDALLADKQSVGGEVQGALIGRAAEFGVQVRSVGLRDIILPGEMKAILNQVIEAEKRAQAELIKRREETAAARSQANTARLLADNPVLARIRELELLQTVLQGTTATFVLGPGDIAEQVRSLVTAKGPAPG